MPSFSSQTVPDDALPEGIANPLGVTCDEFAASCAASGVLSDFHARNAYRALYREGVTEHAAFTVPTAPIVNELRSESNEGEVIKIVTRVDRPSDGPLARDARVEHLDIESVVIPMIGRKKRLTYTLCVSSQVGCAMGCGFCETAQMGLVRSLTPAEIVGQWFAARHVLGREIRNIVFMGMGEPLDNLGAVQQAIRVLTDHNGPAQASSRITVSTVGRIDALIGLSEFVRQRGLQRLGLAVSLNAPNDEVRSSIMPINRGMPMAELRDALLAFPRRSSSKLCIEYVLIPGVNDLPGHADELAEYLKPLHFHPTAGTPGCVVNVIPYNPRRDSPWPAPSEEQVEVFMAALLDRGLFVKRRQTKGRDMMGACGQLGSPNIRKRRYVDVTVGA